MYTLHTPPKTALPKTGDCIGIEVVQQIQIVDDVSIEF
jgi:hypothetical protein